MRFSIIRFLPLALVVFLGAGAIAAVPPIEPLGQSSRLTSIVISEIMFHPLERADGKKLEFIELFNTAGTPQDISGYNLSGDANFRFPPETIFPARGFLVVARNPDDVESVYGISGVLGPLNDGDGLPNDNGNVRLRNRQGAILLEIRYDTHAPWPVAADGAGPSLTLARSSFGEGNPKAWKASDAIGGTPGREETFTSHPLRNVVINELLRDGYLELYNHSNTALDLSGCAVTDEPITNKFIFPPGSAIAPGGFLSLEQSSIGFPLNGEETILWRSPDGGILDAVRPETLETNVPLGRNPSGSEEFYRLTTPSPGAANASIRVSDVVFNEIMYHPISLNDEDQYVEIYNRSSIPIDLGGWEIQDGIRFTFPANTIIAPGAYITVAKNVMRLRASHTNLSSLNALGNFSGSLSHAGERIALAMPNGAVVDQVTYGDGGEWGRWSDGGGSSLEKVHPDANGRLAGNWRDSNETDSAPWTEISVTGRLDNGNVDADSLQVLLLGPGECLIDDVEVLNANGINLISNSTFESSASGWIAEGTEKLSSWEIAEGFQSAHSYHVRAVERGDNQINRIRTRLTSALSENSTATLRAKVRWLKGHPDILLRLRGNWLEAAGTMTLPAGLGTPGKRNSQFVSNPAPVIEDVIHSPILPAANEQVLVTAILSDPNPISIATLSYRVDPAPDYTSILFRDDGDGGDLVAFDGVYTAAIPGQPKGALVAFYITTSDNDGATSTFPANAPDRECLVRFGESTPAGTMPVYRLWMTEATHQEWTGRHKLDNTPLDITFVLGNDRVIYSAQALYAGSPYISPGYIAPTVAQCGYSISFPSDDPFLGSTDLVLDWPGGHGNERTAIQEQMAYWLAEQVDLPYSHRYHIRLHVNGVTDMQRRTVFEAVNQPGGDFIEAWSPNDTDGDFYKIDRAFEFTESGGLSADPQPRLRDYTTVGGAKKTERYRWTFLKRAADRSHDYSNIFDLVDVLNAPGPEPFTSATEALVDIEEWMGIFAFEHIIANFDAYGHEIGKNMYAYKPEFGKWQLYMFDLDWLMLAAARRGPSYLASSAPLYNANDPTIERMYQHPPFWRAYLRTVKRVAEGPLRNEVSGPIMDAKYADLLANNITFCDNQPLTDPSLVKTWFAERRAFLLAHLNEFAIEFKITTNDGDDFTTNTASVRLTGSAPIEIKGLRIDGREQDVTWETVTNWSFSVDLQAGQNPLLIEGYDPSGTVLTSDQVTITNGSETPRLTLNATLGGQFLRASWNSEPGVTYEIQYKEDISSPQWQGLQAITAQSTSTSVDLAMPAARRFYRISVQRDG